MTLPHISAGSNEGAPSLTPQPHAGVFSPEAFVGSVTELPATERLSELARKMLIDRRNPNIPAGQTTPEAYMKLASPILAEMRLTGDSHTLYDGTLDDGK